MGLYAAVLLLLLSIFTGCSNPSASVMKTYLNSISGDDYETMLIELNILERNFKRSGLFISTIYLASVDTVLTNDKIPKGAPIKFLVEGGRIGDELQVSSRSVNLEREHSYVIALSKNQNYEYMTIREPRLVGVRKGSMYSFPRLGVAISSKDLRKVLDRL